MKLSACHPRQPWQFNARELAGRQPAPKMLAVIADPVFDRTDSRFTTPATETGDKAQTQTITVARCAQHRAPCRKLDDKSRRHNAQVIPRLPFTRQEATRLLALAPKNSSFGAMDFQANRDDCANADLSQYRYVHFATHGLLDSERPGLSSLVLSMVDAQGKPQDGFLRANDIYNLKLPAELVVLSACQTGLGKEIKGEGLVGTDARIYVRRSAPSGGQPVECERQSHSRADDEVLREDAEAGRASGGSVASRAGRDVEAEAMAVAVLLGGVHDAGRVEVRCESHWQRQSAILLPV